VPAVLELRRPREVKRRSCAHPVGVESEPLPGMVRRRELLRPFASFLEGEPTQAADMVAAGRILARVLIEHGRPVIVCGDGGWAGVWNLERLTDTEAVSWGLWVTMKVRG
jgi:hypothetical protein